jgi:hypothetical protein
MLTVTQAAHAVGRDTSTIRNLILKGTLPATVGRGGRKYIDPADLERAFPGWAAPPKSDVDVVSSAIARTLADRAELLATIATELAEHAATFDLRTIAEALTAGRAATIRTIADTVRPPS